MAFVEHAISEHDTVVLRQPAGAWPVGTYGAVISVYEEAVLVEIVGLDGETLDTVSVPAQRLEISDASADRPGRRPS